MDTLAEHIKIDDGGVARTINRNVKVRMIASKHLDAEMSVTEIAEHYSITLADVHAALAYYYDHKDAFDAHDRELQPLIEEAKRESEARLAKMRARMQDKQSP